jgi:hypothetical protein
MNGRKMPIKKIAILLTFFIFVMVTQVEANDVKSGKYTLNRDMIIKMDENTGVIQKRMKPVKEPARSTKKTKAGLQSVVLFDHAKIPESTKIGVNFLKALEEVKKFPLTDSLHKVTYSYQFFQDVWKDRFLTSLEINGTKPSNSASGQSISKAYPNGDNYFVEGKILPTFKLLQSKGDETFKEIFMGFRFSFDPKSTHMLVEMNISPSSEKGPGVIIPF